MNAGAFVGTWKNTSMTLSVPTISPFLGMGMLTLNDSIALGRKGGK